MFQCCKTPCQYIHAMITLYNLKKNKHINTVYISYKKSVKTYFVLKPTHSIHDINFYTFRHTLKYWLCGNEVERETLNLINFFPINLYQKRWHEFTPTMCHTDL
jgi:hypothetical protein